jgi:Domain of unknown function (DUF305)
MICPSRQGRMPRHRPMTQHCTRKPRSMRPTLLTGASLTLALSACASPEARKSRSPFVRALARRIIDAREEEIQRMRGWFRCRGIPDGTVQAKEAAK